MSAMLFIACLTIQVCKKKTLPCEFYMNDLQIPLCVLSAAKAAEEVGKAGITLSFLAQL